MKAQEEEFAPRSPARTPEDLDQQPAIKTDGSELEATDARSGKQPKAKKQETVTARVAALRSGRSKPTADDLREGRGEQDITILVFSKGTVHGLEPGMTATLANNQHDVVTIVSATQDTAEAQVAGTVDNTRKALGSSLELTFKHP